MSLLPLPKCKMRAWNREEWLDNHLTICLMLSKSDPEVAGANRWYCLLDTNHPEPGEPTNFTSHDRYEVTGRSLILFALEAHG